MKETEFPFRFLSGPNPIVETAVREPLVRQTADACWPSPYSRGAEIGGSVFARVGRF